MAEKEKILPYLVVKEFELNSEDKTLSAFLQNATLSTDMDENIKNDNYVSLMTIHSSKGLEFRAVFLVALEEDIFPSSRSIDLDAAGRPDRFGHGGAAGRVEAAHLDLVGPRRRGPGHLPRQDRAGDGDADGGAEMVDGEVHGCVTREGRRVPTGAGKNHVIPIARR